MDGGRINTSQKKIHPSIFLYSNTTRQAMKKINLLLLDRVNHGWSVLNAASYLAVDPWRNFNLSLLRTQSTFNRRHSLQVESLSSAAPSQYILHGNLRICYSVKEEQGSCSRKKKLFLMEGTGDCVFPWYCYSSKDKCPSKIKRKEELTRAFLMTV